MKITPARILTLAAYAYIVFLFGWLALYILSGDTLAVVSLLNMFAVHLFLPLPLVLVYAIARRQTRLQLSAFIGVLAFAWLWGGLFVPRPARQPASPPLAVMTFNVLGWRSDTAAAVEVIRGEAADIVLLQELNPALAVALAGLAGEYPHQVLAPQEGTTGLGVISRYPLRVSSRGLPLEWLGTPQVLEMDWQGQVVTLVNFHTYPPPFGSLAWVTPSNRYREEQARALLALSRDVGPLIAVGDANATPMSDFYAILTAGLHDAWVEAGYGLGHTYPGREHPQASFANMYGLPLPEWLARIDYVFHSPHWQTVQARTAISDGYSDHRGVVALLALKPAP